MEMTESIIYATGVATAAKQPDAAEALVKLLSTEAVVPAITKNGMDPA